MRVGTFLLVVGLGWAAVASGQWCTIESPAAFELGKPLVFTVTVKDAALAGQKLSLDIHGSKPDGAWGGMVAWGGAARPIEPDKPMTWTVNGVVPKAGVSVIFAQVYASTDGSWGTHTQLASGEKLKVELGFEFDPVKAYRKSWLRYGTIRLAAGQAAPADGVWRSGMRIEVPVQYYLAKEDAFLPARIRLMGVGPWIDCPDGKYTTQRHHEMYGGLSGAQDAVVGQEGEAVFAFTLPPSKRKPGVMRGDSILWLCQFNNSLGDWPWHIRGGTEFCGDEPIALTAASAAGNLFTYDQPVRFALTLRKPLAGESLAYTVADVHGAEVGKGAVPVAGKQPGDTVTFDVALAQPGTFALQLALPGGGSFVRTFARIPDLAPVIKDGPTPFGINWGGGIGAPDAALRERVAAARRMGFSQARVWIAWFDHEVAPGNLRGLEDLVAGLQAMNAEHIRPWLLLGSPPPWAITSPGHEMRGFACFGFRDEQLDAFVRATGQKTRGLISGWEWLNEITPGAEVADPVSEYVRLCRVGTAAARAVDPAVHNQLAGGLWPRSFRQSVLKAGVAPHVDLLPVHYANGGAIEEARRDAVTAGRPDMVICDNESSKGLSTWDMPVAEALADTTQSNWVLEQWTDELMADAAFIAGFGSWSDPAGNWSWFWEGLQPRPMAATIAVFVDKLHGAKPVGKFSLGEAGSFHLFADRNGGALLLASSYADKVETVDLAVGKAERLIRTDYQGVAASVSVAGGKARLELGRVRAFIQGADLDALKAYVVPSIVAAQGAQKRTDTAQRPTVTAYAGTRNQVQIAIRNVYDAPLGGRVQVFDEQGAAVGAEQPFTVAAGASGRLAFPLGDLAVGRRGGRAEVRLDRPNTPVVDLPFTLNVVDTALLGNLLENAGFEAAEGDLPTHWTGGKGGSLRPADGRVPCLGKQSWVFGDTQGTYTHLSQARATSAGGSTMLYTAWVRTKGMAGGSNVDLVDRAGNRKSLYNVQIFVTPEEQETWEVFTAKFQTPADLAQFAVTPVVKGSGEAWFDNLSVTVYEGTDFASQACRVEKAPAIDGDLGEWDERSPIPLIGRNQLNVENPAYVWSPANAAGVLRLRWDDESLYLAAEVQDDQQEASAIDGTCLDDDGLLLLIHPANREPGSEARAFTLCVTAAKPGGSGKHTIFRDPRHSGGLKSGQLARDSSVYDIAVRRGEGRTFYEMRLPFSDCGGIAAEVGTKIGFSAVLTDRDGGRVGGRLNWGEGVAPAWSPDSTGVVTLVR